MGRANAQNMRQDPTKAEHKLWYHLSRRQLHGLKFRRQTPVEGYIADFLCHEQKLIIEIDGGQHGNEKDRAYDAERTAFLEARGFLVLRFWNNDVLENIEGVLSEITNTVNPHLDPPPQGEEIKRQHQDIPLPEGGDQGEGLQCSPNARTEKAGAA